LDADHPSMGVLFPCRITRRCRPQSQMGGRLHLYLDGRRLALCRGGDRPVLAPRRRLVDERCNDRAACHRRTDDGDLASWQTGCVAASFRSWQPTWVQLVVATVIWPSRRNSSNASAGVFQPRVLRGLVRRNSTQNRRSFRGSGHQCYCLESILAVGAQVSAFRKILAQQPVCVLVCATLPRAMRVAKIDVQAGIDL
jgi:hypothetical protein